MRPIFHSFAAVVVCSWMLVGCAALPHLEPRPFTGKLPPHTSVDLAGAFTLSPAGELMLALAQPCKVVTSVTAAGEPTSGIEPVTCDRAHLDAVQVVATTPWHGELRGTWTDAAHLVFRADWKATGIDALADDAPRTLAMAWAISGTSWTPSTAEAGQLLTLIGDATETEPAVVRGGAPPKLEVTAFEVTDGALRIGTPGELVVKIANHGEGAAYRVAVNTRSSVDSLHGQRLSFGMIKPGAEKTRKLAVTVPEGETAPDTMLVLVLAEGNGGAPGNVSHRVPIVAANAALPKPAAATAAAPVLAVHCEVAGREGPRPDLDAGGTVALHCTVDNTGAKPVKIELEAAIGGATPVKAKPQTVAAAGHATFEVALAMPPELAVDSTVEIGIDARDRKAKLAAHATVTGVVRKRKLCTPGQLTRAAYRAKLTELRAAVAAGDMTQAALDRYDAELVTCLQ